MNLNEDQRYRRQLTIRVGLTLAFGAVFLLMVLVSILAGLFYERLGKDLELLAAEAVPLVVQSRNLAMANNSLETMAEKIARSETPGELNRLAEFARLASNRLHQNLSELEKHPVDKDRLRVLNLVQRQIGDLLPELQKAVQKLIDLRSARTAQIDIVQTLGIQTARQLSERLNARLRVSHQSRPHLEELFYLNFLDLQRQLALLVSELSQIRTQAQAETAENNYLHLRQQYQDALQKPMDPELRRVLDRYAVKIFKIDDGGENLFLLQEQLIETQGRIKALLVSSEQLSAQFRLLTTAIVSESGDIVQQVRNESLKDIVELKQTMTVIIALALSLSAGLVWYFGNRRLARPLESLSRSVQALEQGEFQTQAPLQGFKEVQDLSRAFNRMAASLAARDRQLQELQQLLRNVIDSLASALIAVDADGLLTLWNRQAEREFSLDPQTATGLPLKQAIGWLPIGMAQVTSAISERQPLSLKGLYVDRGEIRRCYELSVYPLLASVNSGAVLRIDDVTDRNRIEKMVAQSEKMMSVGGLAAGIAHEINNPLAGILQSVQVILNRLDPDFAKNFETAESAGLDLQCLDDYLQHRGVHSMLQGIRNAATQAAQIVRNMLAFSRAVPEQRSAFEKQDLCALLDQTVALLASDYNLDQGYDFRRIEIVRDYQPGLPRISCAGALIQQVVFNILKNSAQALTADSGREEEPRITLAVSRQLDMLRLEIGDNGPGMSAESRLRVFEPFYTTKAIGKGTGLGMSVSYFIITQYHRGSIEVESRPGEGSNFIILLPLREESE